MTVLNDLAPGAALAAVAEPMRTAVTAEMRAVLAAPESPTSTFYRMLHYHMGWVDVAGDPQPESGGKQIRPLLCLLTNQAAGGDWRQAVPAAAAIELLHNFSLIHDDIEDVSPLRRGRPTVWQVWQVPQAINSGDAMFAFAHLALSRLADHGVPAERVVRALRRFDETCVDLTVGQYNDMDFELRTEVTVEDYLDMVTGKTAVLLSLCAELGALIAGADDETIARYAGFGRALGLAFQVRDDVLGIWGDEALIGKSAATDITTRKKTLPVLFGLTHSERLRALYAAEPPAADFVTCVVAELDTAGARTFAEAQVSHYSEAALQHLAAAGPVPPGAAALQDLAQLLLTRHF